MKNNKALFKLLIVLLFTPGYLISYAQTTYFVTQFGAGTKSGSSWNDASDDLQKMMDAASSGDQIWVAQGTYLPTEKRDIDNSGTADLRETIFYLNKNIKIYGGFTGTESALSERDWELHPTILSGDLGTVTLFADNSYHVLYIDASLGIITNDCVLDGFYIRRGNANGTSVINQRGGGIYLDGRTNLCSPLLNQIFVFANSASYGGGIFVDAETGTCSPQITHSHIENNSVTKDGGGIYFNAIGGVSSSMIKYCIFDNNTATNLGGAVFHLVDQAGSTINPEYSNCIFTRNSAEDGGGMANVSINGLCAPVFRNSTFFTNTAGKDNGVMYNAQTGGTCAPRCVNSILWNNEDEIENVNGATVELDHCIFDDGTPDNMLSYPTHVSGVGFMSDQNPQFVNEASFDLHVMPTSPAIDNGNSGDIGLGITEDLDGKPRVNHSAVDLGPYEYFCPLGNPIYVNHAAVGRGDGNSWADAFTDIQSAIDLACECDTGTTLSIWVSEGTYIPTEEYDLAAFSFDTTETFAITKDLKLYGGFSGTETQLNQRDWKMHETILSGEIGDPNDILDNSHHVVYIDANAGNQISDACTIDGFTITAGYARGNNQQPGFGGGVYITGSTDPASCEPVLANLTFRNNIGQVGGGTSSSKANPTFINCIWKSNLANFEGAAMSNWDGAPWIVNGLFYFNSLYQGGGVLYHFGNGSPLLSNCTMVNNSINASAISNQGSEPLQAVSTIFWNNMNEITQSETATTVLSNCIFDDGDPNDGILMVPSGVIPENTIDLAPLFISETSNNFRLSQNSPGIDAGMSSGIPTMVDLDGNPRSSGTIDIGAYENPYGGCPQTLTLDNILYTPLDGVYQAQQSIQLGAGMEIMNTAQVTLDAPEVLIDESSTQLGAQLTITQDGCLN